MQRKMTVAAKVRWAHWSYIVLMAFLIFLFFVSFLSFLSLLFVCVLFFSPGRGRCNEKGDHLKADVEKREEVGEKESKGPSNDKSKTSTTRRSCTLYNLVFVHVQ